MTPVVRPWPLLILVFATGCLGDPIPPSRSPHDPSNPNAREAPVLPLGVASAPSNADAAAPAAHVHAHDPAGASADAGVVYTCAMHPDVIRSEPGVCPKCGMKLIVKSP